MVARNGDGFSEVTAGIKMGANNPLFIEPMYVIRFMIYLMDEEDLKGILLSLAEWTIYPLSCSILFPDPLAAMGH